MEKGLLHIYHGEGKGKSTAAMGLALRAMGRDWQVCIAQFMKSANTGERHIFAQFPHVTLIDVPEKLPFFRGMSQEVKAQTLARQQDMLEQITAFAQAHPTQCLILLDEACSAVTRELLDITALCTFLDNRPQGCEVVITGRNPHPDLLARADYITEMRMERHPFTEGIHAKEGIEY